MHRLILRSVAALALLAAAACSDVPTTPQVQQPGGAPRDLAPNDSSGVVTQDCCTEPAPPPCKGGYVGSDGRWICP